MFKKINNILVLKQEPLKNHCTFKIGGNAKYFIFAHTIDSLLDTIFTCQKHSLKYKIIGGGSNLLFDDLGYNGAIIKYDEQRIEHKDNMLLASSGCDLSTIIQKSSSLKLGGLEFTIGIPIQLGGAIVNNFGAYNNQISDFIGNVTILNDKTVEYLNKDECNFCYHSSIFQSNNYIILAATLNLINQNNKQSQNNCIEYLKKRKNSQPINLPNAGSIFKRTDIIPAKLIEEAGLKGTQIGQAQISTLHSGFIVNTGNASCKDVLALIELIKLKIYEKYNVHLQLEIEYIKY